MPKNYQPSWNKHGPPKKDRIPGGAGTRHGKQRPSNPSEYVSDVHIRTS